MSKKQGNRTEAVRDAAIGYTVVVLGVICFLLVLAVLMAGVRVVVGLGGSGATANTTAATTTTTTATATTSAHPLAASVGATGSEMA